MLLKCHMAHSPETPKPKLASSLPRTLFALPYLVSLEPPTSL